MQVNQLLHEHRNRTVEQYQRSVGSQTSQISEHCKMSVCGGGGGC